MTKTTMTQQDKQQNKQQDGNPQNRQNGQNKPNRLQDRFKIIQMASSKRIMAFLDENDVFHALDLLHKIYKIIFNSVKKNQKQQAQGQEQEKEQEQQAQAYIKFTLFDDVAGLIQKKLQDVSIRDLEEHIYINNINNINYLKCLFDILKTAAITGNSTTTQSVRKFIRGLGSYISSRLKVKEAYNKTVWGGIFSYLVWNSGYYASDEIVNECAALEYIKQSHLLAFDYYYGLLTNGITDVIKEYFYTAFIKSVSIELKGGERGQQRAKYRLFLAITAYAYTYYLAEKALLDTSAEECKSAKSIIEDKSVKESFCIFMSRLSGRDELSDILSKSFDSDIENFLYNYEIIAYDSNNKSNQYINRNISSGLAAREFFLFFAGFIAMYCYDDKKCANMLDSAFDVEEIRYYISTEQEKDTIAMFTKFFDLIKERRQYIQNVVEEKRQDMLNNTMNNIHSNKYDYNDHYSSVQSQELYYALSMWLNNKEVYLAEQEQQAFNDDISYADYLGDIAEKQLKKDFGNLLERASKERVSKESYPLEGDVATNSSSNDTDNDNDDSKEILHFNVPTHMAHDKKFISSNITGISNNALSLIICLLKNRYNFPWIEFASINEYLDTLKKYNIKTLIGGENKITGIDFTRSPEEWQQAKKEMTDNNYKTVVIPTANVAIALKAHVSLSFKYNYIVAYIRSLIDKEIKEYVEELGNRCYRYRGDNLRFNDMHELNTYVKNRYKAVIVRTKIEIQNALDNNKDFTGFIFS